MDHLGLLGHTVRDRITGFRGTVTSICFDLYGCVQACVIRQVAKDGKRQDGEWFDTKRLIRVSKRPVMARPTFQVVDGPEKLPLQRFDPTRG